MTKADERKQRLLEFLDWLKNQDITYKGSGSLLSAYSFKTGIAVRTLTEFFKILESVRAIKYTREDFEGTRPNGTKYTSYRYRREINQDLVI